MATDRRELLTLLDGLCECRLSVKEYVRLDELVTSDDDALRLYVDYLALHGTLHWDTAVGDDAKPPSRLAATQREDEPTRRKNRRRAWMTAIACAALVVTAFVALNPPGGDQLADEDDRQRILGNETAIVESDGDVNPSPPPIVRLDPRETDPETTELAANDPPDSLPESADTGPDDIVAFIDEQLTAGWAASEITPSPRADDAEWVRRASLDLAGQIPDLDTIREFLDSGDSNKREQYIAGLLRGGDFSEHLTTVWANLLVGRNGRTAHERRGLEEFLLTQFRQNRPWNEIVGELIAAEGTVEENGAAGFLLAHLNNEAVPATAITARLFLGEQVQCSQCHKHPWNDEPQEQFWTLNAFFHQTDIERRRTADDRTVPALVTRDVGGPTYYENLRGIMQVAYPQFRGEEISPEADVNRRQELARLLSDEDGYQLAKAFVNRMWAHFFGYGIVNPIDDMGPHHAATHPELLDRLASEFAATGYDIRKLVRWITSSQAYHLSSRLSDGNAVDDPDAGSPPLFSRVYVKPLAPEQLFDSVLVATDADRAGSHYEAEALAKRRTWVRQFFEVLENEENGELSTFDGTVPQALAMMNGPLVQEALSGEPGTLLHRIFTSRGSDADKVHSLCLAALSREPTEQEQNLFTRHVRQAGSPRAKVEAYRDIFWAYLNSNEFVVNH